METAESPINALLDSIETTNKIGLEYRPEIAHLLNLARSAHKIGLMEEVLFLAKFCSRTYAITKRIGPAGEGYDKLAVELAQSLDRATALIRGLLETAPPDFHKHFTETFLSMNHQAVASLFGLFDDLTRVKNHLLDTERSLPT